MAKKNNQSTECRMKNDMDFLLLIYEKIDKETNRLHTRLDDMEKRFQKIEQDKSKVIGAMIVISSLCSFAFLFLKKFLGV